MWRKFSKLISFNKRVIERRLEPSLLRSQPRCYSDIQRRDEKGLARVVHRKTNKKNSLQYIEPFRGRFLVFRKSLFMHCLLVIVFWFGYGLWPFESFVLRHLVIATSRNSQFGCLASPWGLLAYILGTPYTRQCQNFTSPHMTPNLWFAFLLKTS